MEIPLHPYNPSYPASFAAIAADLSHDLLSPPNHAPPIPYTTIHHVGSTAVPLLSSPANPPSTSSSRSRPPGSENTSCCSNSRVRLCTGRGRGGTILSNGDGGVREGEVELQAVSRRIGFWQRDRRGEGRREGRTERLCGAGGRGGWWRRVVWRSGIR